MSTIADANTLFAGTDFAELPAGEFTMGELPLDKFSTETERPAHRVRIAHHFALGRFPVTTAEYREFSPAHEDDGDEAWPVVNVSWDDAVAYCAWLARETGKPFRLPCEAEWEYACRLGGEEGTPFASGHDLTSADANFLCNEAAERVGPGHRTIAGEYPANEAGLLDMHGNVCEWTADAWHASYHGAPADGSAWSEPRASRRVIRGGAWDYLPRLLRATWRDSLLATARRDNLGFRLALTLEPEGLF